MTTTTTNAPPGAGPCAKQQVKATIIALDGRRFVGTNHCMKPQAVCPRADMPTGVGYELCKSVCEQEAHAEVNATRIAGEAARNATLYLEGHTYACQPCQSASHAAGIAEIIIGAPPA
jgi:deoxycytidylate deaminase